MFPEHERGRERGEKGMWEGWKGKMGHGWVFIEMLRAGCSFIQMLVYYEMLQKLILDQKCLGWLHEMWNNERVCISHVKRGAWGLSFPDVDVVLASRVLPLRELGYVCVSGPSAKLFSFMSQLCVGEHLENVWATSVRPDFSLVLTVTLFLFPMITPLQSLSYCCLSDNRNTN